MARLSISSSAKLALVLTGILSVAVAVVVVASAPAVAQFYLHQAPAIWSSLAAWLRPPYLYLVINFIIITIAASSRFHAAAGNHHPPPHPEEEPVEHHHPRHVAVEGDFGEVVEEVGSTPEAEGYVDIGADGGVGLVGPTPVVVGQEMVTWVAPVDSSPEKVEPAEMELPDAAVSYSASPIPVEDKPLLSARFGHRKPVRSSPEGAKALRVSRPKRQETLENTWKTITEGRPMRLTRHLKKSETFSENHDNHTNGQVNVEPAMVVRKLETFKDRTNQQLPPVNLRKEPSLSQDELNRRVEAFITKFNEEMRLQRQASLNQYKEMISNGGLV